MAKPGNAKAQKVDHRGSYAQLPLEVVESPAFALMSMRARCMLIALLARFNGYNNGTLGASAREIGDAIGSHRYTSNKRARHELEEAGFAVVEREYAKGSRLAFEFRLTFIESGNGLHRRAATNEWKARSGGNDRKILGDKSSARNGKRADTASTERKQTPDTVSTHKVETPVFLVDAPSTHIVSHLPGPGVVPFPSPFTPENRRAPNRGASEPSCGMDLAELRTFTRGYLAQAGVGAQSKLAAEASVPGGSLSKFLAGRGLAEHHRLKLQLAVGKAWPIERRKAAG